MKKKDSIPKNVQLVYTNYLKKYGKLNEVEKYEKYLQENDVPRNALQQFKNLKEIDPNLVYIEKTYLTKENLLEEVESKLHE